ncbi:MAG: hypothetical protein A4E49_02436 [Methanosaeta sp. PtaU1.Bin112]|nr:MAG: hypothetical protein A4E49_02436 [Methanosaeta sp. PtaU1.Bin112]
MISEIVAISEIAAKYIAKYKIDYSLRPEAKGDI